MFHWTLLHLASFSGNIGTVKYILSLDEFDPNEKDRISSISVKQCLIVKDLFKVSLLSIFTKHQSI